ncbi:hypothetical protein C5Y96_04310 [Blastopirellula marina]|uniref:Uncharacterized protein n=1 Tax=Blastopirellula marina TaxID=124 RepID=A0A2S8G4A1_9BACT|nr:MULTISPECIES: hypothetical protein [Pirellulaceae]PQO39091.1 hypothetical protein C5Y96_04310 [Blastopirellula marina]RCS55399.1 hypothetical protein DTL36_04320 [Bremerella cremea]
MDDFDEEPGWGFKWHNVAIGMLCLLGGGGWLVAGLAAGYIYFFPIAICIVGACFVLDGLLGADGVW